MTKKQGIAPKPEVLLDAEKRAITNFLMFVKHSGNAVYIGWQISNDDFGLTGIVNRASQLGVDGKLLNIDEFKVIDLVNSY